MNATHEVSPKERIERLSRWSTIRRDRLLRLIDALDARRHRTARTMKTVERTAVPVGAVAAALVGTWLVIGAVRSRRRRLRRSPFRRAMAGLAVRLELAPPRRSIEAEVLRGIVISVVTYAGSLLARRAVAALLAPPPPHNAG